jgi:predicted ATPase
MRAQGPAHRGSLGPAREVAQIGSVIGRGFSYKLLKAVAGIDDAPLEAALEKLSDTDTRRLRLRAH